MQASWGAENGAPRPARGAELYGEKGRYVQSAIESVPWYLTRAELKAAKGLDLVRCVVGAGGKLRYV